ncbi:TPA: VOC family protein [Legionella pneumophila]
MLKKVAFTLYPVEDIERAKSFYKNNLGLVPSKISANGAWVEYDLPQGGCFAITTLAQGVKPSSIAGGSIAFEVENLDELTDKLKKDGVHFKLDTFSSPVCRMAIILDSEGNAITLHELKNR